MIEQRAIGARIGAGERYGGALSCCVINVEARFREAYGAHRAAEGRALDEDSLFTLPYLTRGPHAKQWSVRARTFDAFVDRVLVPASQARGRPLRVLDLGAGNGWLSWRVARAGHDAVALDLRDDDADGLGAGRPYAAEQHRRIMRVVGAFQALPVHDSFADMVVFNASLHYAVDLAVTLAEAWRVTMAGGRVVILDSPFYRRESDGDAMVVEKRRHARRQFGERADALMALPFIEYLTAPRLHAASTSLGVQWRRHRVRYPLWYELRPLAARVRGQRVPSRFDVWEGVVA